MQLGASIWGFYYRQDPTSWPTLPCAVERILTVDSGLGVEVWDAKTLNGPPVTGDELNALVARCRDAAYTTVHARGAFWSWHAGNLREEIDFAQTLGAAKVILHPACFGLVSDDDRPDWPEIVRIAGYAADRGVHLVMENTRNAVWALDRILDELGDDPETTNLGICIDIGHAHQSDDAGRESVINYLERYAGQLVHLHLHDNHGKNDDHLVPGEGTVDWSRVGRVLQQIGFGGTAVFENHQLSMDVTAGLEQGLTFLGDTGAV